VPTAGHRVRALFAARAWLSDRRHSPRFQGENFARNLELVGVITKLAQGKRCTPSQLALAWLMARGNDVVPIPGTKRVPFLEENAAAAGVELTREDLAEIDRVAPKGAAAGERYPAQMMQLVNR
jgi:aryl-alcohol dehydrogenase-like predicted oxidoreductase